MKSIRDVQALYNLPDRVIFCAECTMSNQRPRITFDTDGVCSACNFSKVKKNSTNWDDRWAKLEELADSVRSKDGAFDVVVPCSGGKDGTFVAHTLKTKLGLNPLCVTWAPLRATEHGQGNLRRFLESGFNHIMGTPNPEVTRKLTRDSFRVMGDPFQPFIYGQTNFPLKVAVDYGISLVMYGENGEVEYGGDMSGSENPNKEIKNADKHYFSGRPLSFWAQEGYSRNDLALFQGPSAENLIQNKTKVQFLSFYTPWDPQSNFYYAADHCGFQPGASRSEGTYSRYASLDDRFDGFHYYLAYIKFGIGRATSDSAHEIRDGIISREEGVSLVQKYDGEFPGEYFEEFLDYCELTKAEFEDIIDSWRSPHIWKTDSSSGWQLVDQVK
jgi:N-acetyl sugar amidotransferase